MKKWEEFLRLSGEYPLNPQFQLSSKPTPLPLCKKRKPHHQFLIGNGRRYLPRKSPSPEMMQQQKHASLRLFLSLQISQTPNPFSIRSFPPPRTPLQNPASIIQFCNHSPLFRLSKIRYFSSITWSSSTRLFAPIVSLIIYFLSSLVRRPMSSLSLVCTMCSTS